LVVGVRRGRVCALVLLVRTLELTEERVELVPVIGCEGEAAVFAGEDVL